MLRFDKKSVVDEAEEIFQRRLAHSRRIEYHPWRAGQTFWQRWQNHWAHFLLARIDPLVALRQFRTMDK
jgi:hypothetical protein